MIQRVGGATSDAACTADGCCKHVSGCKVCAAVAGLAIRRRRRQLVGVYSAAHVARVGRQGWHGSTLKWKCMAQCRALVIRLDGPAAAPCLRIEGNKCGACVAPEAHAREAAHMLGHRHFVSYTCKLNGMPPRHMVMLRHLQRTWLKGRERWGERRLHKTRHRHLRPGGARIVLK